MPESVNFYETYLTLASNTADFASARTATIDEDISLGGRIREAAGGRRTIVRRTAVARQVQVTFSAIEREFKDWVDSHLGQLMVLRDPRGRVYFGTTFGCHIGEIKGTDRTIVDVSFVFEQTTATPEV